MIGFIYSWYALFGFIYSSYVLFGVIYSRYVLFVFLPIFILNPQQCSLKSDFGAIGKYLWGKKINEIRMMKQYKGVIGVTKYTIFKRTKESQLLRSLQSTAARYQLVPKRHKIAD